MRTLKTDIVKLRELHARGMRVTAIAQELGVNKSNVSRQLKKLNLAATKNIIVEQAPKVVRKYVDDIDHMQAIINEANRIREVLSKSTDRADMDLSLKACNQSLKQIVAKAEMAKIWHNMDVVAAYHEIIIELLRQTSPKLRDDFLRKIDEHRALSRALKAKPVKPLDDEDKRDD